jgi:hypothetical protein
MKLNWEQVIRLGSDFWMPKTNWVFFQVWSLNFAYNHSNRYNIYTLTLRLFSSKHTHMHTYNFSLSLSLTHTHALSWTTRTYRYSINSWLQLWWNLILWDRSANWRKCLKKWVFWAIRCLWEQSIKLFLLLNLMLKILTFCLGQHQRKYSSKSTILSSNAVKKTIQHF